MEYLTLFMFVVWPVITFFLGYLVGEYGA
jgi:hypothetical protein